MILTLRTRTGAAYQRYVILELEDVRQNLRDLLRGIFIRGIITAAAAL